VQQSASVCSCSGVRRRFTCPELPERVCCAADGCVAAETLCRLAGVSSALAAATMLCARFDGRPAAGLAAAGLASAGGASALWRRCTLPQEVGLPHLSHAACKSMPRAAITKTLAIAGSSLRPIARRAPEGHLRRVCAEG